MVFCAAGRAEQRGSPAWAFFQGVKSALFIQVPIRTDATFRSATVNASPSMWLRAARWPSSTPSGLCSFSQAAAIAAGSCLSGGVYTVWTT